MCSFPIKMKIMIFVMYSFPIMTFRRLWIMRPGWSAWMPISRNRNCLFLVQFESEIIRHGYPPMCGEIQTINPPLGLRFPVTCDFATACLPTPPGLQWEGFIIIPTGYDLPKEYLSSSVRPSPPPDTIALHSMPC